MSKIEVDAIDKQSGSTLTLGGSGTAVTLACGATQSGFGREGSVNWQTGSIKTTTFTAANGEGYFVDTSSGAVTVNLPAGSAGAIVAFADYTRTFNSNNLTVSPNGSEKIGGIAEDAKLTVDGQSATFVYVDATEGWINVQETQTSQAGLPPFINATGGTITTCGNFKIHTFTGPGSFVVCNVSQTPAENTVGYMVVAGGGGGGGCAGGGGGAGGFREGRNAPVDNFTASPLVANAPTNAVTITQTTFPITVGGGGTGQPTTSTDSISGNNSTFSTITSAGGGRGGGRPTGGPITRAGGNGGAGGGNGADHPNSRSSGNTPPVSPPQGKNGGANPSPGTFNMGGTGGAGATVCGGDETSPEPAGTKGANGGAGATTSITGSPVAYAGGGGAGGYSGFPGGGGCGGTGGGGRGARPSCSAPASFAVTGTANTGGGGGAGSNQLPGNNGKGAAGGSGIVIIRYKFQ